MAAVAVVCLSEAVCAVAAVDLIAWAVAVVGLSEAALA